MLWKKDEEYYINRGTECYNNENFEEAISYFKKAIDINPKNFTSYNFIASIYVLKEDLENAIKYYSKAIDAKPNDIMAYIQRGNLYKFLKKYEEANKDLSKAIDISNDYKFLSSQKEDNNDNSSNNKMVANIYSKLQDLIKLDSEVKTEQMLLAYYYRGKNNIRLKDNQIVVNDFNKVVEICDNNNNLKNKLQKYKICTA